MSRSSSCKNRGAQDLTGRLANQYDLIDRADQVEPHRQARGTFHYAREAES